MCTQRLEWGMTHKYGGLDGATNWDELTSRARLEKRKGILSPCVPSYSVTVWIRRWTSSRLRTIW